MWASAVPYLLELEKTPAVSSFESPLPQEDVEGNAMLRSKITRADRHALWLARPSRRRIREEVCDGFVIGGGAHMLRQQARLAAQFNKPFFLQLVGTGLTTAFMLHFGATLTHATWPAVTCHEIYVDDLLKSASPVRDGYVHVPEAPGLGVELDEEAIARYRVEPGYVPPPPRNLYRVTWPSGAQVTYPVGKRGIPWNRWWAVRRVGRFRRRQPAAFPSRRASGYHPRRRQRRMGRPVAAAKQAPVRGWKGV